MKQYYKLYLCALLLVGATGMMTARAQGSDKPTLAVFVVGMDNSLGDALATQIGAELNRNSRYNVLSSATDPVKTKLAELRTQGARSINRNALAEWGRANGVSTICLVTDDIKGSDNMFYAQLIDAKDSKLSGKGSYIRTGVATGDLPRVSSALAQQLDGTERKHRTPAPAHSYPAELDIEMVRVLGGTFTMGCTPEQGSACSATANKEYPHSVTVRSFSMGKYLITRAQWLAVMKNHPIAALADPNYWKDDDQLPIEQMSWLDVDTVFLPRLNALTGKNYRLPTEAEWEYAARGCKGNGSDDAATCEGLLYSGSNDPSEVGWILDNAGKRTHIVGQKKPNGLGIYDMTGNVFEFCSDWYSDTYYKNSPVDNPKNTTPSAARTGRGGSWGDPVIQGRTGHRGSVAPNARYWSLGLRVALDLDLD